MNETALQLVKTNPGELMRMATDCAGVSREIVLKTAVNIQGRKYVKVEGWQAIAVAHGCVASSRDVEIVKGGVRAIGEVRRMSDGVLIATAEGFVGEDEPVWFGGKSAKGQELPKRAEYAIRAMAQTRSISRACRSAFAHVVVLIDSNLSTTPAEEVPPGGFIEVETHSKTAQAEKTPPKRTPSAPPNGPVGAKAGESEARFEDLPEKKPAKTADVLPKQATEATRTWFLNELAARTLVTEATEYFRSTDALMPNEELQDLPLDRIPTSKDAAKEVIAAIQAFAFPDGTAGSPDDPNAAWRTFPIPFGKQAGKTLAEVDKKFLYGFWAGFKVETEFNGKSKKPETIAKDQLFRDMLDEAGKHYQFEMKD